jgi:hypothetical protein
MKRKALSIVAAIAVIAVALIPFANSSAWTIRPAGAITYTLTREIYDVTDNVTNTFTYTITPEASNPAAVTGVPTATTIEFDDVAPSNGKAVKTSTINFSSAEFSQLGEYGFTIKETHTTDETNYPLSSDTYTAWVSVRNVTDSNGLPTGEHIALLTGVTTPSGTKVEAGPTNNKVIFKNGTEHTYIEVSTNTSGNSADRTECFKLNIKFTGDREGNYNITSNTTCDNDPVVFGIEGISGDGITTIYLRHGDIATIGNEEDGSLYQIPVGLEYVVVEEGADDYKTYFDGSEQDSKMSAAKVTVGIDDPNFDIANKTAILNDKHITPRTGITLENLPFAIIAIIGIAGLIIVAKNKK